MSIETTTVFKIYSKKREGNNDFSNTSKSVFYNGVFNDNMMIALHENGTNG